MSFNWVDITDQFHLASNELDLGELFHDEMFGLFEAMSAIEMMDPKMDAGMMCNRSSKKPHNFKEALEAGSLKISNLRLDEKIGIMDDTLSCLITWLEGHSLAQTVFTNVYLQSPLEITDSCLRSFCIVVLKLVDIIREVIIKAGVFEEEDFQPLLYGYRLQYEIPDSKATSMLREVDDELQKRIKSLQNTAPSAIDKAGQESCQNGTKSSYQDEITLCSALSVRVRLFRLLFSALTGIKKEISVSRGNRKGEIENRQIEDIKRQLTQCDELFSTWQQSVLLGLHPDPYNDTIESKESRPDYPTIMGFEPLVNQRLLPPTFPRYTKMKSRSESINYAKALVQQIHKVFDIYQSTWYHEALQFFDNFSKTDSCVLSRSILQVIYMRQNHILGETLITDSLRDAVQQFIKPPCLHPKSPLLISNPQAKEYVDLFFNDCIRPMVGLMQISGHNRARQRERLAQILEELASLQNGAEKLDTFLNRFSQKLETPMSHMGFFSTWIIYHILRVMVYYVISGFELELYSTHEYPYVFWYLYEFLYGWLCSTLTRAITLQEAVQGSLQGRASSKKNKLKKRTKPNPLTREVQICRALQELCGGYYRTVYAFKMQGKLKEPSCGINSEKVRYEHRFAPFGNVIAPPIVSYDQYVEMTEQVRTRHDSNDLCIMAYNNFNQAKLLLEEISEPNDEILSYVKVAKTNLVVVKLLLSGQSSNNLKAYPEFDFSISKNFPTFKIW
ncbi:N-alpha-acetyltransferase 35, NatC auxiliary subunit [Halotydeus destructor]|nr:N-alpha-acetyltransferase 35, NatC auxiliary subunit [Halotydeus destructor]